MVVLFMSCCGLFVVGGGIFHFLIIVFDGCVSC